MTKMIIFDLDGTLTKSKMAIDGEMAKLLEKLLAIKLVGVTSGASIKQFKKQLLKNIKFKKNLENLLLLPTNGAGFFRYQDGKWQRKYQYLMSNTKKVKIITAFQKTFKEIGYKKPETTYGPIIEDRGSQLTFEALGQRAPLAARKAWNKTKDRRKEIKKTLEKYLGPDFQVMIAGLNSIDVLEKGLDKSFAIGQMRKYFKLTKKEILFVGDAVRAGANDYAAVKSGAVIKKVTGPEEVKTLIRSWL
jgi:phosphomannomutase